MKRIMIFAFIASIALTFSALGAPGNKKASKSANRATAHSVAPRGGGHAFKHAGPVKTSRSVKAAKMHSPRNAVAISRTHSRSKVAANHQRNLDRARTVQSRSMDATRLRRSHNVAANAPAIASGPATINQPSARVSNARIVNNWQSDQFSGQNYAAFRDYQRRWHDRSWWSSNYTRIILVSGGWWYWDAGYWYPAWGYDPAYSYYPYDGPIYGYGDLTPDRVIINVQTQLRNDGYYGGRIDGVLGPQTRRALAAFQADHGLAVTSSVDRPTLATLGLT